MLEKTPVGRMVSWKKLPRRYKGLLQEAEKATERAYNPLWGFFVGASFLSKSGEMFSGANFETSVPRDSICAEKAALSVVLMEGDVRELQAIAVSARSRDSLLGELIRPCGSCCQMISEVAQVACYDLEVIMATTRRDQIIIAKISELLPFAFGPKSLGPMGDPTDLARTANAAS